MLRGRVFVKGEEALHGFDDAVSGVGRGSGESLGAKQRVRDVVKRLVHIEHNFWVASEECVLDRFIARCDLLAADDVCREASNKLPRPYAHTGGFRLGQAFVGELIRVSEFYTGFNGVERKRFPYSIAFEVGNLAQFFDHLLDCGPVDANVPGMDWV
jgi:hypothetical protein